MYETSIEAFHQAFRVNTAQDDPSVPQDSKLKLIHAHDEKFKVFPYVAHQVDAIRDLHHVAGCYLSLIENRKPVPISMDDMVAKLTNRLESDNGIDASDRTTFQEMIRQIFFETTEQSFRPMNLRFLLRIPCEEPRELKLARYLADTLGESDVLRQCANNAFQQIDKQSNALERFAASVLETTIFDSMPQKSYVRITNALKPLFHADFEYVMQTKERIRDNFVPLLEFYYFMYTAQTCLQMDRLVDGDRDKCRPLYFCLEWEKASQNRPCFIQGWEMLKRALKKLYAHAVTLEILNQTKGNEGPFDYIKLGRLASESPKEDQRIASEIRKLTDRYRQLVSDCPEMRELQRQNAINGDLCGETREEICYLFSSVKKQFEFTGRTRAYVFFAAQFEQYCDKYLKSRGRNGKTLNLTKETLLFLTMLCVKDQEKMRLNRVFSELERRGVFLDSLSREQVMRYYEKLNLIEKKSDSGDAQYVKRIL